MHDQEAEKSKKTGWKEITWGSIALLILVVGVIAFLCTMHKLPHAEWRTECKPLSWKAAGVAIDHAEAYWKASAGDSRMELRSYCYPVCQLKLDEAEGTGMVTVRFQNGQGVQMGDRINIHFKDGKFVPTENNSLLATETEATVRLEDGFLSQDEYTLHQFNQDTPLWRVYVDCRTADGKLHPLGYLSILPNDL